METEPRDGSAGELHGDENVVDEETERAAAEAAAIGGNPGDDYGVPEAERPLAEGGEGVAEGFEQAERELIENASHEAQANPDPTHLQGRPEDERTGAEYGEPDEPQPEDA